MKTNKLLKLFVGTTLSVSLWAFSSVGFSQKAEASTRNFNMSYLFIGDYLSEVAATKGSLDAVSPDYFEVDSSGNLKVTYKYSKTFVDEMHQQGMKVTPFLSNNWNRTIGRAGLQNRQALAQEIATQVNNLNLDGVNIDIEGLTEADRGDFTDFIKILNSKIPDKDVSVAVAANPYNWTAGWQAMYDYKALADNSDYLMIMAYDENWEGDPTPGPVASLPWVDKSVQYAINQGASPEKVVLGLPFYGRLWKTDGPTSNGTNVYGEAVSQKNVAALVNKYNGTVVYDTTQHTEMATFTIKPGDPASVAGGITLTPGNYVLWYDDQKTISEKIELVHKYNIKGTGSWSLYQEEPTTWDYFRNVLDGVTQGTEQTQSGISNQTTYTVVSGDYLSKIAVKYGVTVQDIKDANGLTTDMILVGQILIIPAKDTIPTATPAPTSVSPQPVTKAPTLETIPVIKPAPKPAPVNKPVTRTVTVTKMVSYKVVRGDSLSVIAKKYHTTATQLKNDNHLRSNTIRIGQILKVRTTSTQQVAVTNIVKQVPPVVTKVAPKPAPQVIKYKVVRGDCLSRIAKKYHTNIIAIKKANGLRADNIHIGQVLIIK